MSWGWGSSQIQLKLGVSDAFGQGGKKHCTVEAVCTLVRDGCNKSVFGRRRRREFSAFNQEPLESNVAEVFKESEIHPVQSFKVKRRAFPSSNF